MIDTVATAAVLYAIAAAEGVRQLPADAIVLRRFGLGRWRFVRPDDIGLGLRVVSWCLPLSLPLVAGGEAHAAFPLRRLLARMRARRRRTQQHVLLMRVLGLVILADLVVGVPLAVLRLGSVGLALAVMSLILVASAQATWTGIVLRRNGRSTKASVTAALKLLSPFSAPRAAEVVFANNVAGVPPLAVACDLLGAEELVRAMRPEIYDIAHRRTPHESYECLAFLIGEPRLIQLLQSPPEYCERGNAFCPRCATEFSGDIARCSDCEGVSVLRTGGQ